MAPEGASWSPPLAWVESFSRIPPRKSTYGSSKVGGLSGVVPLGGVLDKSGMCVWGVLQFWVFYG